jgi:hypothetical protein
LRKSEVEEGDLREDEDEERSGKKRSVLPHVFPH